MLSHIKKERQGKTGESNWSLLNIGNYNKGAV